LNILLCHNYYKTRAGESLVFQHEKYLLEKFGNNVCSFTRDNSNLDNFSTSKKISSFFNAFHSNETKKNLNLILSDFKPDVVHIHNVFPLISPTIYDVCNQHNLPIVQTLHNFRFICPNGLLFINGNECPFFLNKKFHCVTNKCYKNSFIFSAWYHAIISFHKNTFKNKINKFIALNSFSKNIFVKAGYNPDKIIVKPNSASADQKLATDNPQNYILFAGRLSNEKGLFTLLKAAANVPKLPLKIIGSGPLENSAREFISNNKLNHIEILGYQPQKVFEKFLANALATVLPSECFENCPLTVINSLYLGTPVIASKTGGMADFVSEPIAGKLFIPGDVNDLTKKLNFILENKDKIIKMRPNVRKWGTDNFSPENNYKKLINIYNQARAEI